MTYQPDQALIAGLVTMLLVLLGWFNEKHRLVFLLLALMSIAITLYVMFIVMFTG